jgi:hypothetical protein
VGVDRRLFQLNWHRVTFWGSAGVAITWVAFAMASPDGKIKTIFSEQGRDELKRYVRYTYPKLATKWGFDEVHVVPKPPPVATSK